MNKNFSEMNDKEKLEAINAVFEMLKCVIDISVKWERETILKGKLTKSKIPFLIEWKSLYKTYEEIRKDSYSKENFLKFNDLAEKHRKVYENWKGI